MKPRKTFSVAELLWKVNFFLENSKPEQVAERNAKHSLMSSILHETGNYKGFGYNGMLPNPNGNSPIIPDESRTFFYIHDNLRVEYVAAEKRHMEMFSA